MERNKRVLFSDGGGGEKVGHWPVVQVGQLSEFERGNGAVARFDVGDGRDCSEG